MFDQYLQTHRLDALLTHGYHPCPDRSNREKWTELPAWVREKLLTLGGEAKAGYPPLTACQYMAYVRTGDRQAFEKPYFQRRRLLIHAALAECIADDGSFVDAVIDGLWYVCEESTWTISAHNGSSHPGARPAREHPLPDVQDSYIDLFCAQTAATLCHVLRLLGDKLDAVTPLISRRVRIELEKRVFLPFMTRDDYWWMGMTQKNLNNWTPWILSNLMECMALEMRDHWRLSEGMTRAMRMLDRYLGAMPADGGCDEGAGYWNMAGGSLLDCLEVLMSASGGKIDFYSDPLIRAIGAFPVTAHIQGSYFWNFADCDAKPILDGERLYRYGLRTQNQALMTLGAETFDMERAITLPDTPQMGRLLCSLFSNVPSAVPAAAAAPSFLSLPYLQVFAWNHNGMHGAIKGGNNGESHNHNDVGSFLIYADGEPQIVDAGNMVYTAKTFSDQRYTLWNTRSCDHSLPLIDGQEQCAGTEYAARNVIADESGASLSLEGAYPQTCGLVAFTRAFSVSAEGFALTDTIRLDAEKPVEWVFLLRHAPRADQNRLQFGKIVLTHSPDLSVRWEEIPVTDPRMARNFPGSLWRVVMTPPPARAYRQRFEITKNEGA